MARSGRLRRVRRWWIVELGDPWVFWPLLVVSGVGNNASHGPGWRAPVALMFTLAASALVVVAARHRRARRTRAAEPVRQA